MSRVSRLPLLAAGAAVWCAAMPLTDAKLITRAPAHLMSHEQGAITVGGRERTYRLYVPKARPEAGTVPLVIVLHGGGGSGHNVEAFTVGGFNKLAESEGFLVAYPDAVKFRGANRNWNDGRNVQEYPAQRNHVDDVGFLSALIDHLVATRHADPTRVYVTGPSNGGIMSLRLGCELSGKLAAIAPVIGALAEPLATTCARAGPLPVLMINGTTDPIVPWEGGYVHFGRQRLGRVLSVHDTVKLWVERNSCKPVPEVAQLPHRDSSDVTRVRQEIYRDCQEGTEVILYAIDGGGHTWPGGYQYATEAIVGKTSYEIDGCEVIWEFFTRHRRHTN